MSLAESTAKAAPVEPSPERSTIDRRTARGRLLREVAVVVAVLVVLELVVFWDYYAGTVSPAPDDFLATYNNEPYAWWRDLALWDLPDWVPYSWGGYPAAVSIQNGSWYLPIGLISLLTPYSIHAAAVLQALHVAFGALGVYVIARRWRLHQMAGLFGLVAYFFAVGFYTNGLHPDIVRGFTWAPWVVLCLTRAFPWHRRWSIPLAGLILWQALAGTYPGVVVALAYCGAALVVVTQIIERPRLRDYLLPLGAATAGAALLCVPKYLEAILLRDGLSVTGPDVSLFTPGMVGTLFFPYDMPEFPNDMSMRSFFVVAPALTLALTAWRRRAIPRTIAVFGGTALVLGMPFLPWYTAVASLPGMGLSRFRMSDFRVPLVLAVVLVAMTVLSLHLGTPKGGIEEDALPARRSSPVDVALLVTLVVGALATAKLVEYPTERWVTPWVILAASAAVTWYCASAPHEHALGAAVGLVGLAAVSGVNWAYSVPAPWRFPLVEIEERAWGTTSEDLIDDFASPDGLLQRPARTPLDDAVALPMSVHWNASFYTGRDAVGGYVNIKGAPAFTAALVAVTTPETYVQSRSILAAPGIGVEVDGPASLPQQAETETCARTGSCGDGLTVLPAGYQRGHLAYAVTAEADTEVLFNESYYPGWTVTACPSEGSACRQLESRIGGAGLMLVDVPAGSWDLRLDYRTPGKTRDYGAFLLGLAVLLTPAVLPRRARPTDEEPPSPALPDGPDEVAPPD